MRRGLAVTRTYLYYLVLIIVMSFHVGFHLMIKYPLSKSTINGYQNWTQNHSYEDEKNDLIYLNNQSPNSSSKIDPRRKMEFNCTNVHKIVLKRKIGNGVSKQVFLGLHNERKIAVKMVTRNVLDVTSCFQALSGNQNILHSRCFDFPNMKLMKEILILQQITHPNLLQMLGYCVRSEETESTSLEEHGVVAVYEYGLRFYTSSVSTWSLRSRLQAAYELADLLDYLEHSPLGSLHIADFKDAHFLLKDGHIKLTDMDDMSSQEPTCSKSKSCGYGLDCLGGICPGFNAKSNMDRMTNLFFVRLLSNRDNSIKSKSILDDIVDQLISLKINAAEFKVTLSKVL